ncbi:MAG: hypothetical protein COA47_12015 [Robiginitomaculum sp.]|nr:MAG: hypothetical protein COA47_12015 [Robiginitomaculum sp.]
MKAFAFIMAIFVLGWTQVANAQTVKPIYRQMPIASNIVIRNARDTRFEPAVHGLAFGNTFRNNFVSELDIRTGGLCGGMVYTALDYYNANRPKPNWAYPPAEHEILRKFIYNRQVNSIESNVDKWTELTINPFGTRNTEFFNWGLQGGPGGRMTELKRAIDAGTPVPLGLRSCGSSCKGDHQVLATGYDFGRYKGDLGAYKTDMKIKLYDPNNPGRQMTLIADPSKKRYFLAEEVDSVDNPRKGWLSWFVDTNYQPQRPPSVGPDAFANDGKIHALAIGIATGKDDLRGGNDNLNLTITLHNAPDITINNANRSKRWISGGEQWIRVPLDPPVTTGQIKSVNLEFSNYNSASRIDNWDIKNLNIRGIGNGINRQLYNRPNNHRVRGLTRLTMENRSYLAWINPRPPATGDTSPTLNEPSTLERNWDRPGAYYQYQTLNTSLGFRYCQQLCAKDARCKSYTFKVNGAGGKSCALKENIYPKARNAGAISGIKFKYLNMRN